jgi:hypothetical protein
LSGKLPGIGGIECGQGHTRKARQRGLKIAGGISLAPRPAAFIGPPALKLLTLVLAPLAVGVIMAALGRLRARAGTRLALLDQFGYAFTFALAIALIRYILAK